MAGSIENYLQIVQQLLTHYSQIPYVHDQLADETVFDQASDRYLLLTVGWQGRKQINTIVLHLDIRDGQVWVQCTNTNQDIVEELTERGIDAKDIVLPHKAEAAMDHRRADVPAAQNCSKNSVTTKSPLLTASVIKGKRGVGTPRAGLYTNKPVWGVRAILGLRSHLLALCGLSFQI